MPKKELEYSIHISVKSSYIYVETPKVACSTIKKKLQEIEASLEGITLPENRPPSDIHKKALSPLLSPSDVGFEKFCEMLDDDSVIKFCFVRNPYTRTLSAFLNKIDRPKTINRQQRKIKRILGLDIDKKITFKQFLDAISNSTSFDMDPHWRIQSNQLFWSCINYDFIGYFENLTQDFNQILKQIYPKLIDETNLLDVKTSPHNATNANDKLVKFYNDENKNLVQTIYQKDFLNFNYSTALPINQNL